MLRTAMPRLRVIGGSMGMAATLALAPSSISFGSIVTPRLCSTMARMVMSKLEENLPFMLTPAWSMACLMSSSGRVSET